MTVRGTRRTVLCALALLPLTAAPAVFGEEWWLVWAVATGLLLAAVLGDVLIGLPRRRAVETEFAGPATVGVGAPFAVAAEIRIRGAPRRRSMAALLETTDLLDRAPEVRAVAPPGGGVRIEFPLRAQRRGVAKIEALWLRIPGPWGLAERVLRIPIGREVAAGPDIEATRQAAIRYFRSREFLGGTKAMRLVGSGSEFDSLTEFRPGHDSRAIHWKSSARHRKLAVREFREERNDQIILAFDAGHVMSEPIAGLPRLDHAVHAALLLSFAALKVGDHVGLYSFDAAERAWLPPRGGIASFAAIRRWVAELDYSTVESNFTLALTRLFHRLKRRSLVVLFTEFLDSVMVELMVENLGRLAEHHLVLLVAQRNPTLEAAAAAPPVDRTALARAVVAGELLRERTLAIRRLTRLGVRVIDAPSLDVPARVIDQYLSVKRRERV